MLTTEDSGFYRSPGLRATGVKSPIRKGYCVSLPLLPGPREVRPVGQGSRGRVDLSPGVWDLKPALPQNPGSQE